MCAQPLSGKRTRDAHIELLRLGTGNLGPSQMAIKYDLLLKNGEVTRPLEADC